jgi:signal peptidase II
LLTVFTLIIMGFLGALAIRVRRSSTLLAIGLLMGGAVGNLIDRLTGEPGFDVGHVTDFIAYGTWFVGNVADIWIVLGAAWLALALSREPREEGSK